MKLKDFTAKTYSVYDDSKARARKDRNKVKQFKNDHTKKPYIHAMPELRLWILDDDEDRMNRLAEKLTIQNPTSWESVDEKTDPLTDEIILLYETNTLKQIAEVVGMSQSGVYRRLVKAGVERRGAGTLI